MLEETMQFAMGLQEGPIQPIQSVVMAVGVVIAMFGPADFIAHQDHGHSLANKQDRRGVLDLLTAQGIDARVVRRSFPAAVPTVVVVGSIPVALAVGLIVFVVV